MSDQWSLINSPSSPTAGTISSLSLSAQVSSWTEDPSFVPTQRGQDLAQFLTCSLGLCSSWPLLRPTSPVPGDPDSNSEARALPPTLQLSEPL